MNINQNERKNIIQFFLNFSKPKVQDINKLKIEIIIEIIIVLKLLLKLLLIIIYNIYY
jgi:hypothetical protein